MTQKLKLRIVAKLFAYSPLFLTTMEEYDEGVTAVSAIASQDSEKSAHCLVLAMGQEKIKNIVLAAVYAYLNGEEKEKFINLLNEKNSN